jgi:antitoxin component YwqK of YwqJK toxin-antitoxin module
MNGGTILLCAALAACLACVTRTPGTTETGDGEAQGLRIFKQTYHMKNRIRQYRYFQSDAAGSTFSTSLRSSDGTGDDRSQRFERQGSSVKISSLDGNGRLAGYTLQDYDPATDRLVKQSLHGKKGDLKSYTVFTYDAAGNLVLKTGFNTAGKKHGFAFEFDTQGKLVKDWNYSNGILVFSTTHDYDAAGSLVKRTRHGKNGSMLSYQTYRYDERGNLAEQATHDARGGITWKITREFDGQGRKLKVSYFEKGAGSVPILKTYREFEYEGDRLSKVLSRRADGRLIDSGACEYDTRGNKIKQAYFDGAGNLMGFSTYDYEADNPR